VSQKGYCKAVWFEGKTDKDGNNINQSATIPKDWIKKDTKTVYWPKQNTWKNMCDCVEHPRSDKGIKNKWGKYTLISCGRTYKTYAEADETETATDEVASDLDDPVQESEDGEDANGDAILINTKRKKIPNKKLDNADYTGGSVFDDESAHHSIPPPRKL